MKKNRFSTRLWKKIPKEINDYKVDKTVIWKNIMQY